MHSKRIHRFRRAITVLEVLFSIAIVLVGLVGIATMVPFASRQAASSYNISHGIATGDNALSVFYSHAVATPSLNTPWQLVDDVYSMGGPVAPLSAPLGDSNQSMFESFPKLYEGDRENGRYYSLYQYEFDLLEGSLPRNSTRSALAQNRALGTGFCIDPWFWGYQLRVGGAGDKVYDRTWGNFRRSRFPFYHEDFPDNMNPFADYTSVTLFSTPRLKRVSLRDPQVPMVTANKGWLRLPGSVAMATTQGSDVNQVDPVSDRSRGPLRNFFTNDVFNPDSIVQASSSPNMQSWIATITPNENTPVVTPSMMEAVDYSDVTQLPPMPFYPEVYDVSVVVFSKRNVQELAITDLATFNTAGSVPTGERLARITGIGVDSRTSGTFDVMLNASANVNAKIRIGDWIMLSRNVFNDPVTLTVPIRQVHKWYRVINVTGDDVFPRRVRVSGAPWDWTVHELDVFKRNGVSVVPPLDPTNPNSPMVATLLSNVVNVFQRTLKVSN